MILMRLWAYLRLYLPARNLQLGKFCQDLLGSGFVEGISMPCNIQHKLTIGSLGKKGSPSDMRYDILSKSVWMKLSFMSHVLTQEKRCLWQWHHCHCHCLTPAIDSEMCNKWGIVIQLNTQTHTSMRGKYTLTEEYCSSLTALAVLYRSKTSMI